LSCPLLWKSMYRCLVLSNFPLFLIELALVIHTGFLGFPILILLQFFLFWRKLNFFCWVLIKFDKYNCVHVEIVQRKWGSFPIISVPFFWSYFLFISHSPHFVLSCQDGRWEIDEMELLNVNGRAQWGPDHWIQWKKIINRLSLFCPSRSGGLRSC